MQQLQQLQQCCLSIAFPILLEAVSSVSEFPNGFFGLSGSCLTSKKKDQSRAVSRKLLKDVKGQTVLNSIVSDLALTSDTPGVAWPSSSSSP